MDAQGNASQGADLVFALWDSGAGGLFVTDEDENTSGLSFRVSPVQPNGIAATELIANRLNHGVRIDGQSQIVSQANNTGGTGNTSTFLLNNPGATVFPPLIKVAQTAFSGPPLRRAGRFINSPRRSSRSLPTTQFLRWRAQAGRSIRALWALSLQMNRWGQNSSRKRAPSRKSLST
jgi:hypothetical protein